MAGKSTSAIHGQRGMDGAEPFPEALADRGFGLAAAFRNSQRLDARCGPQANPHSATGTAR